MTDDTSLKSARTRIDAIDENLLNLLSERAELATDVAKIKRLSDENAEFYRPEREAQVLRNIMERNRGPIADEDVARLFREIMSVCLSLEQKLNAAYLGPKGTFSESATLKHFGKAVVAHPQSNIADVFREVEAGACQYGVVPIENSIEGAVNHTLDLLVNSNLNVCGEVQLRIHHNLMTKAETIADINRVYSHQQSLAQCRSWLDQHAPKVERIAVSSNAEAAKRALAEPDAAAIAGEQAAEVYDLPIMSVNIEDEPNNTTRFLILGKKYAPPSGKDKTSLLFAIANTPGALQEALACFAENNVNMNRIESRPSRQSVWEYVFFVDIDGHADEELIKEVLQKLKTRTPMLKVLGSYPASVL